MPPLLLAKYRTLGTRTRDALVLSIKQRVHLPSFLWSDWRQREPFRARPLDKVDATPAIHWRVAVQEQEVTLKQLVKPQKGRFWAIGEMAPAEERKRGQRQDWMRWGRGAMTIIAGFMHSAGRVLTRTARGLDWNSHPVSGRAMNKRGVNNKKHRNSHSEHGHSAVRVPGQTDREDRTATMLSKTHCRQTEQKSRQADKQTDKAHTRHATRPSHGVDDLFFPSPSFSFRRTTTIHPSIHLSHPIRSSLLPFVFPVLFFFLIFPPLSSLSLLYSILRSDSLLSRSAAL